MCHVSGLRRVLPAVASSSNPEPRSSPNPVEVVWLPQLDVPQTFGRGICCESDSGGDVSSFVTVPVPMSQGRDRHGPGPHADVRVFSSLGAGMPEALIRISTPDVSTMATSLSRTTVGTVATM